MKGHILLLIIKYKIIYQIDENKVKIHVISYFQGGPGVQDAHYSIMELAERLGALGAGPSAVGAAAAACRGIYCFITIVVVYQLILFSYFFQKTCTHI